MLTENVTEEAATVQRAIDRQLHHTRKQIEALEKAVQKVGDYEALQVKGTLLKTYASQIPADLGYVKLPDYRHEGFEIGIYIDRSKSLMANAEDYFHEYRRAKRGLATVQENLTAAKQALAQQVKRQEKLDLTDAQQVEQVKQQLIDEGAVKTKVLHSSKKPEPAHPRRFYTTDGVLVEVGKSDQQNDHLSLTANPNFYWMHVSELPGSHVVIHSDHPSDQDLQEAAVLTAYYSKGRKLDRVPVDVLRVRQLSKPKGAKAGLVNVHGKFQTITVTPDADLVEALREH